MAQIGYAAMLEQFHPRDLVGFCEKAEAAGFSGVMAADHVQPWIPQQGQASFVWSFMAAAAEHTRGDFGSIASGDHRPGRGHLVRALPRSFLVGPGIR